VEYRVVPEATERVRLLQKGDADLMLDVPAERMQALAASPQLRTMAIDGMRVFFLTMDCSAEAAAATRPSPFRDRRVREAVALAIDRRALVAGPLGGFGEVIDQIASPQELGAAASVVPVRPVDRDRARALLAQAGYPNGLRVSLDYLRKYRAADAVTKSIADDLATVGIDVVRRPVARVDAERVRRHEVTFLFMGWTSQTGEAGWAYESFLHSQVGGFGNLNVSRYANPALDRLIEDALGQRGPTERSALLARVAQVAYDEVPMVPLYRQADLYAMARNLEFTPRLDRLVLASAVRWRDGARPAHAQ
jgi:peptide/nickel transport system substrate-binding protein